MIIIFDFDYTITQKHYYHFMRCNTYLRNNYMLDMYYNYCPDFFDKYKINHNLTKYLLDKGFNNNYTKNSFIDYFFGLDRFNDLNKLFDDIKHHQLYILSKGDKDNILMCLEYIGFNKYFNNDHVFGNEVNKLDKILELIKLDDIIYIDDSHETHDYIMNSAGKTLESFSNADGKLISNLFDINSPSNNDNKMIDIYYENKKIENKMYHYIHPKYENGGIDNDIINLIKKLIQL